MQEIDNVNFYLKLAALAFLLLFAASSHADEVVPIDWNDEVLNWHPYQEGVDELKKTGGVGMLVLTPTGVQPARPTASSLVMRRWLKASKVWC